MLDAETKLRIDSARNMLVGKVPTPTGQVEQITIALIYKFMDDMDAEAEDLGGKRKFFTGKFAKYGWAQLMSPSLGGHDMLALYSEGIAKMPENSGVPLLFRDIFKNAFLPYRDPETLKAFLKIINEFSYDHSERLGDAFEYLLSVLGSQGDAGQFRTPRHIIDFMVEILNPQKSEVVLDPACGTAGFLISAYKHIVKANTDAKGHSKLTPADRGKLAENFKGYDISPDMVRLSLVNMYLHGFTDPHIYEYDTLTSDERWNEYADVILANPPFMSPTGGIKPHKRFSIQAKRSEVLFVDYMAEHLTPKGRAGIIVPEGIIFQSQTAYRQLRKLLVEEYLVAVVSLPAGCFNPYSGVKTSVLILDKALAKQVQTIAFLKVENDGFNLGAQRRPVEQNDLPQVTAELKAYLEALKGGGSVAKLKPKLGLIVSKERIAANGDFDLSGERYRESVKRVTEFPKVSLGELLKLEFGTRITKRENEGTMYPVFGGGGESFRTNSFTREDDFVISRFAMSVECVREVKGKFYLLDSGFTFSISDIFSERASKQYIAQLLLNNQKRIFACARGHAQKNIDVDAFKAIEVPLPPLEVQQEIVAEINGYQKVINGALAVLDGYRPQIPVHLEWPIVSLGDICSIRSGGTPSRSNPEYWGGDIPWVTTTLINYNVIERAGEFITKAGLDGSPTWVVPKGTVLMAMYGEGVTRGRVAILGIDAAINQACAAFLPKGSSLDPNYLYRVLQSRYQDLRNISYARGGNQSNLSATVLKQYTIPLPPLKLQRLIVSQIETEQALVDVNRELISRFEKKIQDALARIWGVGELEV